MEYIEKKKVIDAIWKGCGACDEEIKQLPTVEIVRCKKCAKYEDKKSAYYKGFCSEMAICLMNDDGFCSWGEKRIEDGE